MAESQRGQYVKVICTKCILMKHSIYIMMGVGDAEILDNFIYDI